MKSSSIFMEDRLCTDYTLLNRTSLMVFFSVVHSKKVVQQKEKTFMKGEGGSSSEMPSWRFTICKDYVRHDWLALLSTDRFVRSKSRDLLHGLRDDTSRSAGSAYQRRSASSRVTGIKSPQVVAQECGGSGWHRGLSSAIAIADPPLLQRVSIVRPYRDLMWQLASVFEIR